MPADARSRLSRTTWIIACVCIALCGGLGYAVNRLAANAVSGARAPDWPRPIEVTDAATAVLRDVSDWQAASAEQKLLAAKAVEAACPEFRFLEMRRFECRDRAFDVAVFNHPKTSLEFSLVPAGVFEMGAPAGHKLADDRNTPAHPVTLTRPFLICRTEVSVLAWNKVPGASLDKPIGSDRTPGDYVIDIEWDEAVNWCLAAGLELPTEAQWEFAARGGTRGPWYFKEDDAAMGLWDTGEQDPYSGPRPGGTDVEARYSVAWAPNAFGLHDTFCAAEWVRDGYAPYSSAPQSDPCVEPRGARMCRGALAVRYHEFGGGRSFNVPVWDRRIPSSDEMMSGPSIRPSRTIAIGRR